MVPGTVAVAVVHGRKSAADTAVVTVVDTPVDRTAWEVEGRRVVLQTADHVAGIPGLRMEVAARNCSQAFAHRHSIPNLCRSVAAMGCHILLVWDGLGSNHSTPLYRNFSRRSAPPNAMTSKNTDAYERRRAPPLFCITVSTQLKTKASTT